MDNSHAKLVRSASDVRLYAGSDCSKTISEMLHLLVESYKHDFMTCSVEEFKAKQIAVRQLMAVIDVIDNHGSDVPLI